MRKRNFHSQSIKDVADLKKRETDRKKRMEWQAAAAKRAEVKAIIDFLDQTMENEPDAIRSTIRLAESGVDNAASIPRNDRKTINAYLNTGYTLYGSFVSSENVRTHRLQQAERLLGRILELLNGHDKHKFLNAVTVVNQLVARDADVEEFVRKRQAMTSYYFKNDGTDVHLKEQSLDYNEQKGEDSDESQQPHTPNAPEPVRTYPESHENAPGVEMPASEEKDAQKSEQATLQSVLPECGMEDSPKTTVDGQTSMSPDGDGGEAQTECGFFHRLKDKIGSSFLKVGKWFDEGEKDEVSDGENHAENDAIPNDENTSEEKE